MWVGLKLLCMYDFHFGMTHDLSIWRPFFNLPTDFIILLHLYKNSFIKEC